MLACFSFQLKQALDLAVSGLICRDLDKSGCYFTTYQHLQRLRTGYKIHIYCKAGVSIYNHCKCFIVYIIKLLISNERHLSCGLFPALVLVFQASKSLRPAVITIIPLPSRPSSRKRWRARTRYRRLFANANTCRFSSLTGLSSIKQKHRTRFPNSMSMPLKAPRSSSRRLRPLSSNHRHRPLHLLPQFPSNPKAISRTWSQRWFDTLG